MSRFTRTCPHCGSANILERQGIGRGGALFVCGACHLPLQRYYLLRDTETGRTVARVWCCRHPARSRRWIEHGGTRCALCGHVSQPPYAGNKMEERTDVEWAEGPYVIREKCG